MMKKLNVMMIFKTMNNQFLPNMAKTAPIGPNAKTSNHNGLEI